MKVAICGAGEMGQVHFDTFSSLEGVQVTAIADPDAQKVSRYEEKGVRTFADSEEMIRNADADVVVIAAPTAFHATLATGALKKGLHVFCEKPMARTLSEGESMVKAASEAGKKLGIGYVLRFHDAYRLARDYIKGGKLGSIGTVRTSRCAASPGGWHNDVEAHGGATFELLTHDLDWLAWSLGKVKRIFARGLSAGRKTVEKDYTLAVVRFENGAIGHLEGSLAETSDFYASYEVAGDEGLLSYDTRKSTVLEARLLTKEGLLSTSAAPQEERPFVRQIRAFVESVENGTEYAVGGEEALVALRLAEAAYKSIQSGRPVEP